MRRLVRYGGDGGAGRDLRADLCRGLALWFICIDHIPGNALAALTLRNIALCDATEAFVLLAGYAAGLAYGGVMARSGPGFAALQALRRVATLYVAHIFLFVVFTAQVGYSAAALDSPAYLDELHLDPFRDDPYRALLEALLLRYQPQFLDILPLYVVLLALFAVAMPLLQRPRLLLALSGSLYLLVRLTGLNLPTSTGGGWFFNPLAWQLLFFIGCAIGTHPAGRRRPPLPGWHPALAALAGLVLLGGAAALVAVFHRPELLPRLPEGLGSLLLSVDKTGLHPLRLASILALAYLVGHLLPREAAFLRGRVAAPFLLLGQHGLPVFCAGIVISFLARIGLELVSGVAAQLVVNLACFGALLGVAAGAAWLRLQRGAEPAAGRLPDPPAALKISS